MIVEGRDGEEELRDDNGGHIRRRGMRVVDGR